MADEKKPADGEKPATELEQAIPATGEGRDDQLDDGTADTPFQIGGKISLEHSAVEQTDDQALWAAIRNRTAAIQGVGFDDFITRVLCEDEDPDAPARAGSPEAIIHVKRNELLAARGYGVDAYQLLKFATQAFLLLEAGVVIREPQSLTNQ